MSYVKLYSHITNKNVQYPLIEAINVRHNNPDGTYSRNAIDLGDGYNNSPTSMTGKPSTQTVYTPNGYGGQGNVYMLQASSKTQTNNSEVYDGKLTTEWGEIPRGLDPIISQSSWDVDEIPIGYSESDLFESDTIKISLGLNKEIPLKFSQSLSWEPPHIYDINGNKLNKKETYFITELSIIWRSKRDNKYIGCFNAAGIYNEDSYMRKVVINTELINILNFNGQYTSADTARSQYPYVISSKSTPTSIYDYANSKEISIASNYVMPQYSILTTDFVKATEDTANGIYEQHIIVDNNGIEIELETAKTLNTRAHKTYIQQWTSNNNEFFRIYKNIGNKSVENKDESVYDIINDNMNETHEYHLKNQNHDVAYETMFNNINYMITGAVSTMVDENFEPRIQVLEWNWLENGTGPKYYIPLTMEVFGGNPNEPEEPETVEPADNPETEYTPPLQEAFEDFPYRGSDTITGLELNYNLFRPSYSNYIFPKYYKDSIAGDSDWESAVTFIQEACNPSAFEAWGATFKLITGHPTPGEIISRVYYLPFEYTEIRGEDPTGFYFSAPVYGPIGPVTLGAKTHSEDPSNTGKPIESHVHYYQQIVNRFKTINLGQVTIKRVFNNFLDFTEVTYTLNLPYGAGQVELDPDLLFKNDSSIGNVKLTGVIDFDTGELTIIIQLNGQRYYETTVNVAIDRLASVADNMAAPLAIAKATMAAAATAGRVAKFAGGDSGIGSAAATAGGGGGSIGSAAATTGNSVRQTNNDGSSTYFERKNNDGSSTYFDRKNGYAFFDERSYARRVTKMEEILKKYQ